jgi:hypothetical protein
MLSKEQFAVLIENMRTDLLSDRADKTARVIINAYAEALFGATANNMPMPFNLSSAENGDKLQIVVGTCWLDAQYIGPNPYVKNSIYVVTKDGNRVYSVAANEFDSRLRMPPREMETVFVNIYPTNTDPGRVYRSEKDAQANANSNVKIVAYAVQIPKL